MVQNIFTASASVSVGGCCFCCSPCSGEGSSDCTPSRLLLPSGRCRILYHESVHSSRCDDNIRRNRTYVIGIPLEFRGFSLCGVLTMRLAALPCAKPGGNRFPEPYS